MAYLFLTPYLKRLDIPSSLSLAIVEALSAQYSEQFYYTSGAYYRMLPAEAILGAFSTHAEGDPNFSKAHNQSRKLVASESLDNAVVCHSSATHPAKSRPSRRRTVL